MNYRHIYHAGNFTEVIKHNVILLIMEHLLQKDAAFCYIDTHAGEGFYDLTSPEAEKTAEAVNGVQRICREPSAIQWLRTYMDILKKYKTGNRLNRYPGSPLWAYEMLRAQDHLILNEFHPEINQKLKQNFYGKQRVAIHHRDAYELLPAILPPSISRGMVLIDPPFEKIDEDEQIQLALSKSLNRWPQGIYAIWYPITTMRNWKLPTEILKNNCHYLVAELTIASKKSDSTGLLGCKLLIINPPWKLEEKLKSLLDYLWKIFSRQGQGKWSVYHA